MVCCVAAKLWIQAQKSKLDFTQNLMHSCWTDLQVPKTSRSGLEFEKTKP